MFSRIIITNSIISNISGFDAKTVSYLSQLAKIFGNFVQINNSSRKTVRTTKKMMPLMNREMKNLLKLILRTFFSTMYPIYCAQRE